MFICSDSATASGYYTRINYSKTYKITVPRTDTKLTIIIIIIKPIHPLKKKHKNKKHFKLSITFPDVAYNHHNYEFPIAFSLLPFHCVWQYSRAPLSNCQIDFSLRVCRHGYQRRRSATDWPSITSTSPQNVLSVISSHRIPLVSTYSAFPNSA